MTGNSSRLDVNNIFNTQNWFIVDSWHYNRHFRLPKTWLSKWLQFMHSMFRFLWNFCRLMKWSKRTIETSGSWEKGNFANSVTPNKHVIVIYLNSMLSHELQPNINKVLNLSIVSPTQHAVLFARILVGRLDLPVFYSNSSLSQIVLPFWAVPNRASVLGHLFGFLLDTCQFRTLYRAV